MAPNVLLRDILCRVSRLHAGSTDSHQRVSRVQVSFVLRAAVLHLGQSVDAGHYVTVVRQDADWLICDDAQVH